MDPFGLLVLVRHGQSVRNAVKGDGRFVTEQARTALADVPDHLIELTAAGKQQAYEAGIHICQRFGHFQQSYTSGYTRADQTVQAISVAYQHNGHAALHPHTDTLIRERDAGYTGNMTRSEAMAAFPWLDAYWRRTGDFLGRPPGGESMADVVVRVQLFLDRIRYTHPHEQVLIVTHGGTIQAFQFVLERWNFSRATWQFGQNPPGNGSVTAYRAATAAHVLEYEPVPLAAMRPQTE